MRLLLLIYLDYRPGRKYLNCKFTNFAQSSKRMQIISNVCVSWIFISHFSPMHVTIVLLLFAILLRFVLFRSFRSHGAIGTWRRPPGAWVRTVAQCMEHSVIRPLVPKRCLVIMTPTQTFTLPPQSLFLEHLRVPILCGGSRLHSSGPDGWGYYIKHNDG